MISTDDVLWYIDDALEGLLAIVATLGDELANRTPDLDGANCAYAVLTHCLGVLEYWGGHIVAGRTIERDRDGEFRARGDVAGLTARARRARRQLGVDLGQLQPYEPPRGRPDPEDAVVPLARTQGGAVLHIFEELAQHRGQLEITRDLLLAERDSERDAARVTARS